MSAQRVTRHAHLRAVDIDELLAAASDVGERTLAQPVVPAAAELGERRAHGADESLFVFHWFLLADYRLSYRSKGKNIAHINLEKSGKPTSIIKRDVTRVFSILA